MAKTAEAAKPGAGKSSDGDAPGMGKAELRQILKHAKAEPLPVTFALGADGKAILRLHRRHQPRALEQELKKAAPDSRNHRFGTASVDPDQPKLVRFQVNRACSGMARKLILALKGSGYNKVEINSDDGAPPDRHDEPDDTELPEDALETPPSAPSATTTLVTRLTGLVRDMIALIQRDPAQKSTLQPLAAQAQASLQAGDTARANAAIDRLQAAMAATPPPQPRIDPQALTVTLTGLAKQALPLMQAGNTGIKDGLTKAHAALKSGDLAAAASHTKVLQDLLAAGHGAAGPFEALAAQWLAAEQQAQADVHKLKAALDDLYAGDPAAAQMEADFQTHIDVIFGQFDGKLAEAIRKASAAKPSDLTLIKADLRRAAAEMAEFLQHDSVALMDSNPLVEVDIAGRCQTALKAMQAALA